MSPTEQLEAMSAKAVERIPAEATAAKNEISYPVLTDLQNQLAEALGIVFDLPAELEKLYETFGNNLPEAHGEKGRRLPIPATYVVGSEGTILFASVARDYRTRAEPDAAIAILERHAGKR